jgi:hypothetical protein
VRTRRATASAPAPPDDGYRNLSVAEVLADLPSLDRDQLLLVRSLEQADQRRPVILARIDDLLVVREAAHHVATTESAPLPPLPNKAISPDLLDQMGGVLAKDAVRRSPTLHANGPAYPPPLPPPAPVAAPNRRSRGKGAHAAPNGLIVPTDGRRSRGGRRPKVLARLVIVVLVLAAGGLAWQYTHRSTSAKTEVAATIRDPLAARLVASVPPGFVPQADSVGNTGPSDLAKAARDDGGSDAQGALTAAGFLHGYQRLWSPADKAQQLIVILYHFKTADGAAAYGQRMAAAAAGDAAAAPAPLAISGIPGAVGFSGAVGSARSAQAIFTRGVYTVGVIVHGRAAATAAAQVQQIATAQYALLPAG